MTKALIMRVGTEPVVGWSRSDEGLPRWTILLGGWEFRERGGSGCLELGVTGIGSISATVTAIDGVPLVPSDPIPPDALLENGMIRIACWGDEGYTIAELRDISLAEYGRPRALRWLRRIFHLM